MSDESQPRFANDCQYCRFLGREGWFDLYQCSMSAISGFVWRWGVGDAYTTMPEMRDSINADMTLTGIVSWDENG